MPHQCSEGGSTQPTTTVLDSECLALMSALTWVSIDDINFNDMKRYFLILLVITGCLQNGDWADQLRSGDYDIVEMGRYSYTTRVTGVHSQWNALITEWRSRIEENIGLLPVVVDHLYPEEGSALTFKYKYTGLDEERSRLVLRYFAPIVFPDLIAGYQYQFVVDLKSGKLVQILLSPVPLES